MHDCFIVCTVVLLHMMLIVYVRIHDNNAAAKKSNNYNKIIYNKCETASTRMFRTGAGF